MWNDVGLFCQPNKTIPPDDTVLKKCIINKANYADVFICFNVLRLCTELLHSYYKYKNCTWCNWLLFYSGHIVFHGAQTSRFV